jgi:SprT protein
LNEQMRPAAKKPSLFDQLEFCFESAEVSLPSAEELCSRCIALLDALGARRISRRLRVQWNPRMRSAVGRADFRSMLISLNPALQNFGAEEIERTLRHELAHLLAQFRTGRRRIQPHGPEWQRACRDLDIPGERACHRLPIAVRELHRRFLYRCTNCEREFPRVRRLGRATACLACCRAHNGGEFDPRFRLRLVNAAL